jgi:hypothetical protein
VLQDIKVGRQIELPASKKFIENDEAGNGVELEVITNYFRKPRAKAALLRPSAKRPVPNKRPSKEKQSVKNSREKSEKCLSKASADSLLDPHRKVSKKKTGSLSKDNNNSQSRESKPHPRKEGESPAKKVSKSKSHEKKKKEEGQGKLYSHQEEDSRTKPSLVPVLPKSPKAHTIIRNKSPLARDKHK